MKDPRFAFGPIPARPPHLRGALGGRVGVRRMASHRERRRRKSSRQQTRARDSCGASKTYGDALVCNEPKLPELIDLYARGQPDARRGHAADGRVRATWVIQAIIDTYFQPRNRRSAVSAERVP